MTFSLRLTADLMIAFAARIFGNKTGYPLILQLSSDNHFDSRSASVSAASQQTTEDGSFQSVARIPRYRSPIVWIGGSNPLEHPQVARFSNALAVSDRHVFLETSGASLKRCLHEFLPSSRFYFTVRFDVRTPPNDDCNAHYGEFVVGLEALRMARIAGFFTCAHLVLHAGATIHELEELHAKIGKLDVDGFLITPAVVSSELAKQVSQASHRLLPRRWTLLSSLLDTSKFLEDSQTSPRLEHQALHDSEPDDFGEGAEA